MHARAKRPGGPAGRDKAALLERFSAQMRATARRYSADAHDAEDAYQRAAEILLTHDPRGSEDQLCRWLRTVVKHEAFAIRRARERLVPLGAPEGLPEPRGPQAGTHERAEQRERLSVWAQALRKLKPQEVRCLRLRAEGYSYEEICARTGWTYTKVNRCLTEGRRAFLRRVAGIESGAECAALVPALSALADGEAPAGDAVALRAHLETCLGCRARLREFRAVPARVAALAPPVAAGAGLVRGWLESLTGAAQHKAAVAAERLHAAAELATAQKAAAVVASAAAIAGGGGAVERAGETKAPAKRPAAEAGREREREPAAASPTPPPQPQPVAAAATPQPRLPPPAPDTAREFAPAPATTPLPARGAGGGSSAEFTP